MEGWWWWRTTVQYGTSALGKAHIRSTLSLKRYSNIVFEASSYVKNEDNVRQMKSACGGEGRGRRGGVESASDGEDVRRRWRKGGWKMSSGGRGGGGWGGGWTGGRRPGSSTSKSHSGGQVRQRGCEGIRSGVLLIRKLLAWHHSGWRCGFPLFLALLCKQGRLLTARDVRARLALVSPRPVPSRRADVRGSRGTDAGVVTGVNIQVQTRLPLSARGYFRQSPGPSCVTATINVAFVFVFDNLLLLLLFLLSI